MEIWKPIPGYVGFYQVSDLGRVRSVTRKVNGRKFDGVLLKHNKNKSDNYHRVHLYREGSRVVKLVHRLVLETFKGCCPDSFEGQHLDGNPSNNQLTNLAWSCHSDNELQKYNHGTIGVPVVRSDGAKFPSISKASRKTGISGPDICSACKGRLKTAGGYGWSYDN